MIAILLLAPPIIVAIFMAWRWFAVGRDPYDPDQDTTVAQFEAPERLNPILCDLILNNVTSDNAIIATVLQLCVSGHFKLLRQPQQNSYTLELAQDPTLLDAEQQQIVALFFPSLQLNQQVNLTAQTNEQAFSREQMAVQIIQQANQKVTDQNFFATNPATAQAIGRIGWYYIALIAFLSVSLCGSKSANCSNFYYGLSQITSPQISQSLLALLGGLTLASIADIILSTTLPRRTPLGNHLRDNLVGFKQFIQITTLPRIKLLQLPTNTPTVIDPQSNMQQLQLTEPTLPYSIIFEQEKEWLVHLQGIFQSPKSTQSSSSNPFLPRLS